MKKLSIIGLLLCCAIFLIVSASYSAEDTDKVLNELQSELQNKGMPAAEIAKVKKPVKEMLGKGATKDGLKGVLLDLSNNGVKGKDLRNSVDSMNNLIKSGESPQEAGNIVSRAVHQGQAQGLRGKALADRVHQAVHQMQTEKKELKEMKKERKEMKRHSEG